MEKEKKGLEEVDLENPDTRRKFLTKAAVAAGAMVTAGLVRELLGEKAEAAEQVTKTPMVVANPKRTLSQSALQYTRLPNGHSFSVGGKDLSDALAQEGILGKNIVANRTTHMSLGLTWD